MKIKSLHSWKLTPREAIAVQRQLAGLVVTNNPVNEPELIAGVDMSPPDSEGYTTAAVVVLRYPEFIIKEVRTARRKPEFPYVPGLLSFRESPVILEALEKVACEPDLVLVDGQGQAHPRRMGIASHIGLLVDRPTIGCAKSRLVGEHTSPDSKKGSYSELFDDDEIIGAAVRTKDNVRPVYVSIGHRIDLAGAIHRVLQCCRNHRLPEPTRLAHQAAAGLFDYST